LAITKNMNSTATATRRAYSRPERPLRRSTGEAILGGVCSGLARRLGVPTRTVRIIAVLTVFFAAIGPVIYLALWIMTIRRGESESIFDRTRSDKREKEIIFVVSIAVIALLIALRTLGLHVLGLFFWVLTLCVLEGLMVWRGSSGDERDHLRGLTTSPLVTSMTDTKGWRGVAIRTGVGIVVGVWGISLLSRVGNEQGAAAYVLIGAVALLLGVLVLFAPWWVSTIRDLTQERRARIRAQDRADMAAHVHDSVMQTLSLIQRAANDPGEVTRLARIQERDLRIWLANPESFGRPTTNPSTLAQAAFEIEREVEDNYGVGVDVVVVGDAQLDDNSSAVLAAGREATINAAKWSGAASISLYIEAEPDQLSMYVRDQGTGFNLDAVPRDRQGISRSIVERMERHGGTAVIRTSPESGTEVELRLPVSSNPS
jgi:signal transduction histidine kinase